ncbi:MAG: hypothetical protein M3069_08135 [Chloroflexota bacterium]|nr:hypothetical protein [Chloroflexota bacterium]
MELQQTGAFEALQDRLAVRIFTLCDHAVVPPDGKLYIHGAGVHTLYAGQIPGILRSLYLVVRLSIPWHMLGEPHTVKIQALDLDRKSISPTDPLITTPFELGRPAGHRPGDESAINICAELNGLTIQQPMTIRFHLLVDDEPIASLPLKVMEMPTPVGAAAR